MRDVCRKGATRLGRHVIEVHCGLRFRRGVRRCLYAASHSGELLRKWKVRGCLLACPTAGISSLDRLRSLLIRIDQALIDHRPGDIGGCQASFDPRLLVFVRRCLDQAGYSSDPEFASQVGIGIGERHEQCARLKAVPSEARAGLTHFR